MPPREIAESGRKNHSIKYKNKSDEAGTREFTPMIEYEYLFQDKSYRSSRRRMGNYISGGKDDAEAITTRYPVGASVAPGLSARPGQSVLEYGVSPLSWIPLGLGMLFISLVLIANFVR